MLTVAVVVCAGVGIWALFTFFKMRAPGAGRVKQALIIYNGITFTQYSCTVTDTGMLLCNGVEYPLSACQVLQYGAVSSGVVYVFAAEPIALTTHQSLMKHRSSVIKGHLFKTGGDMVKLLQMVAAAAVIACAFFVYLAVSSLQGSMVQMQATVTEVKEWTQSPLVVQK